MSDWISYSGSAKNAYENMNIRRQAKTVLSKENYRKFKRSYNFMFRFQLAGILGGYLIPCVVIYVLSREITYVLFGVAFGVIWMPIWLIISFLMPQGKIYRKFGKWVKKGGGQQAELDKIFYD